MSNNLKHSGSPLCDEEEEEGEEEDYQILTQANPDVKCSSSSGESQDEGEESKIGCRSSPGFGMLVGLKLPRAKKKRKFDGPGEFLFSLI